MVALALAAGALMALMTTRGTIVPHHADIAPEVAQLRHCWVVVHGTGALAWLVLGSEAEVTILSPEEAEERARAAREAAERDGHTHAGYFAAEDGADEPVAVHLLHELAAAGGFAIDDVAHAADQELATTETSNAGADAAAIQAMGQLMAGQDDAILAGAALDHRDHAAEAAAAEAGGGANGGMDAAAAVGADPAAVVGGGIGDHPPPNVIVLLLESLRADAVWHRGKGPSREHVHAGNAFLTQLAARGRVVEHMVSNIPNTNKALFATLCGALPFPGLKYHEAYSPVLTAGCLPNVLRRLGYTSEFLTSSSVGLQKKFGFDKIAGFANYEEAILTDEAAAMAKAQAIVAARERRVEAGMGEVPAAEVPGQPRLVLRNKNMVYAEMRADRRAGDSRMEIHTRNEVGTTSAFPENGEFERLNFLGFDDRIVGKPALQFLDRARAAGKPAFLTMTTIGTHYQYKTPINWDAQSARPIVDSPHSWQAVFTGMSAEEAAAASRAGHKMDWPTGFGCSGVATHAWSRAGDLSLYKDSVAYQDFFLEQLFGALERRGHLNNTLVVLMGDHGEGFGEHGYARHGQFLNEEGVHVPMLLVGDMLARVGEPITGVRQQVDVKPTVLEIIAAVTRGEKAGVHSHSAADPAHPSPFRESEDMPLTDALAPAVAALPTPIVGTMRGDGGMASMMMRLGRMRGRSLFGPPPTFVFLHTAFSRKQIGVMVAGAKFIFTVDNYRLSTLSRMQVFDIEGGDCDEKVNHFRLQKHLDGYTRVMKHYNSLRDGIGVGFRLPTFSSLRLGGGGMFKVGGGGDSSAKANRPPRRPPGPKGAHWSFKAGFANSAENGVRYVPDDPAAAAAYKQAAVNAALAAMAAATEEDQRVRDAARSARVAPILGQRTVPALKGFKGFKLNMQGFKSLAARTAAGGNGAGAGGAGAGRGGGGGGGGGDGGAPGGRRRLLGVDSATSGAAAVPSKPEPEASVPGAIPIKGCDDADPLAASASRLFEAAVNHWRGIADLYGELILFEMVE